MHHFTRVNGVWDSPSVPIQTERELRDIPKAIAEEAYKEYAAQFGTSQSLERLCDRGGFGLAELAILLYERIKRIEVK